MNSYFISLFNYDRYVNELMTKLIIEAGAPEKPVKIMAHVLAAQQIWLNRCKGLAAVTDALWPDWQEYSFHGLIIENSNAWLSYLTTLQGTDFERTISYKSLNGEGFENKLTDILAHVINHGTHHRAQIGQQLKLEGLEHLPVTDYIFYLRSPKN